MICNPESTNSTLPVTPRPSALARNTAASATSAGSVLRRNGARWLGQQCDEVIMDAVPEDLAESVVPAQL